MLVRSYIHVHVRVRLATGRLPLFKLCYFGSTHISSYHRTPSHGVYVCVAIAKYSCLPTCVARWLERLPLFFLVDYVGNKWNSTIECGSYRKSRCPCPEVTLGNCIPQCENFFLIFQSSPAISNTHTTGMDLYRLRVGATSGVSL